MISKHNVWITFLNESELIFCSLKRLHLFLSNTNTQLNVKTVLFQTIRFSRITVSCLLTDNCSNAVFCLRS